MGQLEKYGLYVLCLVIFLILGVTIWGGGEAPTPRMPAQPIRADVNAPTQRPTGNLAALAEDIFAQRTPETPNPAPAVGGANGANAPTAESTPQPEIATPAPAPIAEAKPATYKVQKGDTFASIAKSKLGKESLWTDLQRVNPDVQPSKLREGQELKLPVVAVAGGAKPALDKPLPMPADGMRDYVVKKGDSYERIATTQLGGRKRVAELMAANPSVPAEKLRAGMTIKLPKK
jgi:LysM repeat protein